MNKQELSEENIKYKTIFGMLRSLIKSASSLQDLRNFIKELEEDNLFKITQEEDNWSITGWGVRAIATSMVEFLNKCKAKNFVSIDIATPSGNPFEVVVRRSSEASIEKMYLASEKEKEAMREELEFLAYFAREADFGPGDGDVQIMIRENYTRETGKEVPENWSY